MFVLSVRCQQIVVIFGAFCYAPHGRIGTFRPQTTHPNQGVGGKGGEIG